MALLYDLVFAGNLVLDEIHPFEGPTHTFFGGPVQFSAMAAAWSEKKIAVVTKMAESDAHSLDLMREKGVAVHVHFSPQTTFHRVSHLTERVDERQMVLLESAGPFTVGDFSGLEPTRLHLAGLNDQEFTLDFVRQISRMGFTVSVDIQAFVRKVDPRTGETELSDFEGKREIASLAQKIKLDVVEGECLTGTTDIEQAAMQFEKWGASETMVTRADGALVRFQGTTYFESFSNRSVEGRTGRGDTTFGAYLARRLDYGVPDSLKFAAALASIKMETPGVFAGTVDEVLERMGARGL
jgi:sugar/nucleoside kinase (ribokinase family)